MKTHAEHAATSSIRALNGRDCVEADMLAGGVMCANCMWRAPLRSPFFAQRATPPLGRGPKTRGPFRSDFEISRSK
jgi:hypothetical protein